MHESDVATRYKALFKTESTDEMENQFHAIAGDAFENVPPTMLAAFREADRQAKAKTSYDSGLPMQQAEVDKICDSTIMDSLTLDEIILSCVFHYIENYCPGGGADESEEGFQTFLRDTAWKLGDVQWGWQMSPPPPPPVVFSAYDDLVSADPEGVELVREKMMEFWPRMSYVMSQSQGANVGNEYSRDTRPDAGDNPPLDGRGYGPIYYVSRYMASTAFLATEGYADKDSLIARLVQARFTGHFRFACKAFIEWMSSDGVAAAGSNAPEAARQDNPREYGSRFDRNILAIAAVLAAESEHRETDVLVQPNVHKFWEENCVAPNIDRSALPKKTVRLDPKTLGETDALGHDVPLSEIGPLRTFGSLRQIRDTVNGGADYSLYPEDYTISPGLTKGAFFEDWESRWERSIQHLYQERVCNPEFKYTIEQAIGNPPFFPKAPIRIRDMSSPRAGELDMEVPNKLLGESSIDSQSIEGCGAEGNCDWSRAPTFRESSLWQYAYVTSSDDPDVRPGWHRLFELKAWPAYACTANAQQTCGTYKSTTLTKEVSSTDQQNQRDALLREFQEKNQLGLRISDDNTVENSVALIDRRARLLHELVQNGTFLAPHAHSSALRAAHRRQLLFFLPIVALAIAATAGAGVGGAIAGAQIQNALANANQEEVKLLPVLLVRINQDAPRVQATSWRTGRDALMSVRCSNKLHEHTKNSDRPWPCCDDNGDGGQTGCMLEDEWPYYAQRGMGCSKHALELEDAERDTLAEYLLTRRLNFNPPPVPYPPPPVPPPPTPPPRSPPPPTPPEGISFGQTKAILFEAQRAFCDTVYISSAEARCTTLAQTLHQSYVFDDASWTPPSLPPVAPDVDPPPSPPPPPSPKVPEGEQTHLLYPAIAAAYLSTYFVAEPDGAGVDAAMTGARTPLAQANATRDAALASVAIGTYGKWAACDAAHATAPLPCRSGDLDRRCLDGARRCQVDHLDNMRDPWVELDLLDTMPHVETGDTHYFFALEITLPPEEEYGRLLFRSAGGTEDIGYEVLTYDQHHNPTEARCQTWQDQVVTAHSPAERLVQFVCLPALASEEAYAVMRAVRYVRLVLPGELRMVWFDALRPVFRTLRDANPSPPPSPGPPPAPPAPVFPPDAPGVVRECDFYQDSTNVAFSLPQSGATVLEEPCGLTPKACCALAHEEGAFIFDLSLSGCCTLYKDGALAVPGGLDPPTAASGLNAVGVAGVGVVV